MNGASERRCGVVYNPIKVSDDLREAIARHATATGWDAAIWLATPAEDPGPAITDHVVSAGEDRVIVAGGDGTVRIVADRLAETGIPMAVVPLGTGNLLARNLDIPLSEAEALEVAFGDASASPRSTRSAATARCGASTYSSSPSSPASPNPPTPACKDKGRAPS